MALYSLNLCIAYTRGVKKSVGRGVKTDVVDLSLRAPRCPDEARDRGARAELIIEQTEMSGNKQHVGFNKLIRPSRGR